MKTKLFKKIFISMIALFTVFTMVNPPTQSYAQSGEGVDVCSWWNANGFSSYNQCVKWFEWASKEYVDKNNAKIKNCAKQDGINSSIDTVLSLLTKNPARAIVEYGKSFIKCMFGS